MGQKLIRRIGGAGLLMLGTVAAFAQDTNQEEPSGVELTLELDTRLEVDSNLGLTPGGEDATTQSVTALTFGLVDEVGVDRLNFSLSAALRIASGPDFDGTETILDNPTLRFGYTRDGDDSSFSVSARYRRDDITFSRLADFTDDDGVVELPDDLDDLNGEGTRTNYSLGAQLNLMESGPFSLSFDLGISGTDYQDTSSTALFDSQTVSFAAEAGLRFSQVLTGTVTLSHSQYDEDDTDETRRTTDALTFGLTAEVNHVLTLTASLGHTTVETENAGTQSTVEGTNASLGMTLERPNGTFGAELRQIVNEEGERLSFTVSRDVELPRGALSGSLGVTRGESGETDTIASLRYRRDLPTGRLLLSLNRSVSFNETDDEEELSTTLRADYSYTINDLSAISLSATFATVDDDDFASLGVTYSRDLTEDWALRAGYTYDMEDLDGSALADSHGIFIGLNRSFSLRP